MSLVYQRFFRITFFLLHKVFYGDFSHLNGYKTLKLMIRQKTLCQSVEEFIKILIGLDKLPLEILDQSFV